MPEDQRAELATLVSIEARQWWHTPLIPALRRQRQMDLCEFKTTLGYTRLNQSKRNRGHAKVISALGITGL